MTYVVSDGSEEEVGKLVCGVKLEVVDDWGFGGRGRGASDGSVGEAVNDWFVVLN